MYIYKKQTVIISLRIKYLVFVMYSIEYREAMSSIAFCFISTLYSVTAFLESGLYQDNRKVLSLYLQHISNSKSLKQDNSVIRNNVLSLIEAPKGSSNEGVHIGPSYCLRIYTVNYVA